MDPTAPAREVTAGAVVASSLGAALAAWALLAVLERHTSRARAVWTAVALGVLAASLVPPVTAGVGPASKAALALMHVAVAAALIPLLRRTSAA